MKRTLEIKALKDHIQALLEKSIGVPIQKFILNIKATMSFFFSCI